MVEKTSPPLLSAAATRVVADQLHSAAIHLLRRLRRVDDATGLSAPKLSALAVIVYGGPITLGDLAAAEQVRPPTMTRLVQELEQTGLVERQADADDRRIARVKATPRGSRLLKQGRSKRVALLAEWLATLSGQEFETLAEATKIIQRFVRPN